jgi:hypothetical protein
VERLSWRQGTLRRNQLTGSHACVIFKVGRVLVIGEWLKSAIDPELSELERVCRLCAGVKSKYLGFVPARRVSHHAGGGGRLA